MFDSVFICGTMLLFGNHFFFPLLFRYILRKLAAFLKKRYKLKSDLVGVADVCSLYDTYMYSICCVCFNYTGVFVGIWISAV